MRDEDKPFVCTKGKWGMQIRPRNLAGWRALCWWMAALFAVTGMHLWFVATWQDQPAAVAGSTILFVGFALGWAFNMIRWMLARSVVITRD